MITAWRSPGSGRDRSMTVALRLAGFAVLLLGLVYAHAGSPDRATSHVPGPVAGHTGVIAHTDPVAEGAEDDLDTASDVAGGESSADGHGHQHAAGLEECALGQPTPGPDLPVLCLSPLGAVAPECAPGSGPFCVVASSWMRGFVTPIPHAAESPVLQV